MYEKSLFIDSAEEFCSKR